MTPIGSERLFKMTKENILFFLIPKQKVVFVYDDLTLDEALNQIQSYRFAAIPVLNRKGNYVGTLSEGDILWYLKSIEGFTFDKINQIKVSDIPRLRDNEPVNINSNMESLISRASKENFVPVLDNDEFVGIITRKKIIDYFFDHQFIVL